MSSHHTFRKITLTGAVASLIFALAAVSPLSAQSNPKRPAEADRLHVVLLMAGHDADIGNADMKDIAAMKQVLGIAFNNDRNRVVLHDLTGINSHTGKVFSAAEIIAYLRAMKVGRNDNVLVFHSGHGGINDKKRPEETHILTVDGGRIARKDIRLILAAKQPRALMILTDCCSSYMEGADSHAAQRPAVPTATVNVATVRNLLLKTAGMVNITAAMDGTEAIAGYQGANPGQAGSAFTVALMRLWYTTDVTFASWEQLYPALRTETERASGGKHQARAFQISTSNVTTVVQNDTPPPARVEVQRGR